MLERIGVLGVTVGMERFQREILVAPLKKETAVRTGPLPIYARATNSTITDLRKTGTLPKYGKATDSAITDLPNRSAESVSSVSSTWSDRSDRSGRSARSARSAKSARSEGYNTKSFVSELEKRRADIFALSLEAVSKAQDAMARAREAEERCERAESRLEHETNQRLMVERRLKEFEEDRLRQIQAVEVERVMTLKAVHAHREVISRLKSAESRIKEAEDQARSLSLALAEADRKMAEAVATARTAEEKAQQIESVFLGEDAAARGGSKRQLVFGLLMFANRKMGAAAREATEKHKFDWSKNNSDVIQVSVARDDSETDRAANRSTWRRLDTVETMREDRLNDVVEQNVEQNELEDKLKLIFYGLLASLLLFGLYWLLVAAFL